MQEAKKTADMIGAEEGSSSATVCGAEFAMQEIKEEKKT